MVNVDDCEVIGEFVAEPGPDDFPQVLAQRLAGIRIPRPQRAPGRDFDIRWEVPCAWEVLHDPASKTSYQVRARHLDLHIVCEGGQVGAKDSEAAQNTKVVTKFSESTRRRLTFLGKPALPFGKLVSKLMGDSGIGASVDIGSARDTSKEGKQEVTLLRITDTIYGYSIGSPRHGNPDQVDGALTGMYGSSLTINWDDAAPEARTTIELRVPGYVAQPGTVGPLIINRIGQPAGPELPDMEPAARAELARLVAADAVRGAVASIVLGKQLLASAGEIVLDRKSITARRFAPAPAPAVIALPPARATSPMTRPKVTKPPTSVPVGTGKKGKVADRSAKSSKTGTARKGTPHAR